MKTIEHKSTTWLWSDKTFAKWQKPRSNNRRSPKILPYYARLLSFPSLKTQHFCFSPRRWTKYVSMGSDAKNWLTHATALSAGSEFKSCVLHRKIVVNSKLSNRWKANSETKNEFSVIIQKKDEALFPKTIPIRIYETCCILMRFQRRAISTSVEFCCSWALGNDVSLSNCVVSTLRIQRLRRSSYRPVDHIQNDQGRFVLEQKKTHRQMLLLAILW